MDRVSKKEQAKKMIVGNKWYLWKPLVFFYLIIFVISFAFALIFAILSLGEKDIKTATGILSFIAGLAGSAFAISYAKYCLDFVRGKKMEWNDVLDHFKKHWVSAFLVSLVVGLIIAGCSILLVIPGIIATIGLMFYQEVYVDNPELKMMEIIKKSWNMTKGYKMDIFVTMLSFIGWAIVAELTLGILLIWLIPYINVTFILIYEELKNKKAA